MGEYRWVSLFRTPNVFSSCLLYTLSKYFLYLSSSLMVFINNSVIEGVYSPSFLLSTHLFSSLMVFINSFVRERVYSPCFLMSTHLSSSFMVFIKSFVREGVYSPCFLLSTHLSSSLMVFINSFVREGVYSPCFLISTHLSSSLMVFFSNSAGAFMTEGSSMIFHQPMYSPKHPSTTHHGHRLLDTRPSN